MTAGIEGSSDDMTVFEDYAPDALVRAAFCSEANFSSWADPRGVELEISRIMYPAPRLQADELAGGIFHYGNRFFLQCLEGPREAIEAIYRRNSDDVRHKNTELLVVEPIERRMFPENHELRQHAPAAAAIARPPRRRRIQSVQDYTRDAGRIPADVRRDAPLRSIGDQSPEVFRQPLTEAVRSLACGGEMVATGGLEPPTS